MDLRHLNPEQRAAVHATEGPVLVLAGAGSGKTRVITHRVAHLLELGIAPEQIVALSFTNKAADEMRERLQKMVGKRTADELVLGTFHSLGALMMRADPKTFGLASSRFAILDQGDAFGLIRGLLREHGYHSAGDKRRFDVAGILARIGLWKNEFITPEAASALPHANDYEEVAASLYGPYEERLRALGAADFDDLVCRVVTGLDANPEARDTWRTRFAYLMVDEYQDTNRAQLEFLRQLLRPDENLCVVGDDDQAIYGWRGAKIANILGFDIMFPSARTIRLERNYRSRPPILRAANAVVAHNEGRHPKTLVPTRDGGDPVEVVIAPDGASEPVWVVKRIRSLLVDEGVSPGQIAVLYRSSVLSRLVEETLQEHGFAYRVLGGQAVYDRKEVRDAMAYLRVLVSHNDEPALRRALHVYGHGIGHKSLERLQAFAEAQGVGLGGALQRYAEVEGLKPSVTSALAAFSAALREAAAARRESQSMETGLRRLLDRVGLRDLIDREASSSEAANSRWDGVDGFLRAVGRYEGSRRAENVEPNWRDYVSALSRSEREKRNGGDEETTSPREITLATLHSAKGLEWDYVFLIGCEDGILPHRRVEQQRVSDAVSGDIEEERRLFYVGITRARERLWLTRAGARSQRGQEFPTVPSRFLAELPSDTISVYDVRVREELGSDQIQSMADAFLARVRPTASPSPS